MTMMERMMSAGRRENHQRHVAAVAEDDGGKAGKDVGCGAEQAAAGLAVATGFGQLRQVDAGQHADAPGDDQHAHHKDQGPDDGVLQSPRGALGRRGEDVPLPVRHGPGHHADEDPQRGADHQEQGQVGANLKADTRHGAAAVAGHHV
jgi:hypothetical protein